MMTKEQIETFKRYYRYSFVIVMAIGLLIGLGLISFSTFGLMWTIILFIGIAAYTVFVWALPEKRFDSRGPGLK